nr:DNA gyrase inhibitor YacG [Methylophaga frappieri]
MVTQVECPNCGQKVAWSTENKWRPFCCERCKLIDLGDWAAENHRIAGESVTPPEDPAFPYEKH